MGKIIPTTKNNHFVKQETFNIRNELQTLNKTNRLNGQVKLTGSGSVVYADTLPIPTANIDGLEGWQFTKTAGAEKFNYYVYSEGNNAQTLGHIDSVFFTGAIFNYINASSCPFVVVYTKPTGIGDAGLWYHSKISYSIDVSIQDIQIGEKCLFYAGKEPFYINSVYRAINLHNRGVIGDGLQTEEILTIAIHSDSAAANTTSILISDIGYKIGNIKRYLSLVA